MRNKTLIIALLPILIFVWIIGWTASWLSRQKKPQKVRGKEDTESSSVLGIIFERSEEAEPQR